MNRQIPFTLLTIFFSLTALCGKAQHIDRYDTTTAMPTQSMGSLFNRKSKAPKVDTFATYSVTAYTDVYYASYTDNVRQGDFQKFPTVSPRNNSLGLNDIQVSARYDGDKIRGMATVQYGDIAQSAWSKTYNNIQEAHIGVRICKTLWIDAGFFRTHFGTEYLLPVENIASSVAVATYYEPYYEAGVRLNYDPNPKLEINLFLLNGYGIFEDNNKKKSFGAGVTYNPTATTGLGYTNYIGNDAPDSIIVSQLRIAQNVFVNYHKGKVKVQAGADLYIQEYAGIANSNKAATAYSALTTIAYQLTPKMEIYGRGEAFNDANAFLSPLLTDASNKPTGYKLWGATAGIEYKPVDNAYMRLEGRRLQMANGQDIFFYQNNYRDYRYEIMVTAGISFSLLKGVATK